MNRGDIRTLVLANTRRTDKVTEINNFINLAQREITERRMWFDLMRQTDIDLPNGTLSITLPDDMFRMSEVRLIDIASPLLSRALFLRPKSWVVTYYPYPEARYPAKPVFGYVDGRQLYVVPKANREYNIRITDFPYPPDLALDTDTPQIRHIGNALVARATYWTFASIEREDMAERWEARAEELIRSAIKLDQDNPATKYQATQRDAEPQPLTEYWIDPFAKFMP